MKEAAFCAAQTKLFRLFVVIVKLEERMKTVNLVGRQISKLRYQREWTQDELADALQRAGWLITRSGVSKIEGGSVYVPDFRLHYLAHVLGVEVSELLPRIDLSQPIHEMMLRYIRNEKRGFVPE